MQADAKQSGERWQDYSDADFNKIIQKPVRLTTRMAKNKGKMPTWMPPR